MSAIADALKTARQPVFLVELEFGGITKRYATRTVSVASSTDSTRLFLGYLLSAPEVGSSFNFSSCQYAISNVSVEIANKDRLQDYEPVSDPDGGEGRIYMWCDGLTWEDIETDGLLMRGKIEKEDHDKTTYRLKIVDKSESDLSSLPGPLISTDNWPNHRTEAGGGSVAGKPAPMIFGDFGKGIPLLCVDTTVFAYIVCSGYTTSTYAEYGATTENVYDLDGAVIAAAGYAYGMSLDMLGNPVSAFVFAGDKTASEPLSCSIRGVCDTSGNITGTQDALIENPGDIVIYILQNRSSLVFKYGILGYDDFDWTSFRTIARLLPAAKFASYINSSCAGIDYLDRLLSQCLCPRILVRGILGCVPLDLDAEQSFVLSDNDLIGLPTFSRTDADCIANDWVAQYGLNPATGTYEKTLKRNKDNDDDCRKSVERYGAKPQKILELPDVQSDDTAAEILHRHVTFYAYRRDTVTLSTIYHKGFDPIEGDVIALTLKDAPATGGGGWSAERSIVIEKKYRENSIEMTLMKCEV